MRVQLTCVLWVAVLGSRARADDTLTLPQVIAAAVRASPDLERASLDATSANAAAIRAAGIEDTHLGASLKYTASRNLADTQGALDHDRAVNGTLSISKLFSTGTAVSVAAGGGWEFQRSVSFVCVGTQADCSVANPPLIELKPESTTYQSFGLFSLTQPLLRGAGASAVEGPIRDARAQRDAAALARDAKARDLVVSIVEAYWQVALAKAQLDVRKTSLQLANEQLRFTEGAIRADKVAKSELLAVQQVIATRELDSIAAEQQIYDRSLALRQLAGLEIGPAAIDVATQPLPAVDRADIDLPKVLAAAFERSAELASLAAATQAAQAGVDTANGLARSQLDLALSAGPFGTDSTLGKSITRAAELNAYEVTASLTFDRAIEQRTERGTVGQARARLLRAKVDERAARARIAAAATRAVQRAKAALASVALADTAIALAEQNIEAERHRFDLGKSTNFEVLRRQDELEAARLRHVAAIVDYLSARAEIDGLTGQILSRFGIAMH